jgi:3-carboxy-cis,cis-muconate cycloisomerase
MSELFWPGDRRARALFSDEAFVAAMVRVEAAWLRALRAAGVAPDADPDAVQPVGPGDLAAQIEAGGNPVIPLVQLLRARVPEQTGRWLHGGLTSQDVLDSALMLCLRDVFDQLLADAVRQVSALRELADTHRHSVQAGRTLTQHAVPTTFGLTAASWLAGVLDAANEAVQVRSALPVQAGGAAGTLAAVVALTGDAPSALRLVDTFAADLGLAAVPPWHTSRRPVTRVGDALAGCLDAWGRIANDVLVRARPEIGELSEPAPGGSSTMPHKQNPILSVLLRRAAITAPFAAAQLHAAAAAAVDERPDGAWHAEWATLRVLGRMAAVAASQAAELLEGLVVHPGRMRATADATADDLLAEQRAVCGVSGELASYLGATDLLIDRAIDRAERFVKDAR